METDLSSTNMQYLQQVMAYMNQMRPEPTPGPKPGPEPGPGPSPVPPTPPVPPPGPSPTPSYPDNGDFLKYIKEMTPTERADAVPSAEQLENLEMANNYQQDYEDAVNADNPDQAATDTNDNGGLSSPDFYAQMYRDGKALDVNQWVQDNLYNLDRAGVMSNQYQLNVNLVVNIGASGGQNVPQNFMSDAAYLSANGNASPLAGATDRNSFFQGVQNFLSPQNVADRTVDFAASLYSGGNNPAVDSLDSRQSYADGVRSMVDRSFNQTTNRAGNINQDAWSNLNQTRSLIDAGLNDFVQNGLDANKNAPGGLYDQLRDYAASGRTAYGPAATGVNPESAAISSLPSMIDTQA